MKAYGRVYSLTISAPENVDINAIDNGINIAGGAVKDAPADSRKIQLDAIKITNLQMEARVASTKASGKKDSPVTTIKVFNLAPTSREFIKKGGLVELLAGYEQDEGDLPLVFSGQVVAAYTETLGPNKVTTLTCTGDANVRNNVRVSLPPVRGSTYASLIASLIDIAALKGLPLGHFIEEGPKLNAILPSGMPIQGYLLEEISKVLSNVGYRAYVTLGKLFIEPLNEELTVEAVLITSDTLAGSIKALKDTSGKNLGDPTSRDGVKVTIFLNGRVDISKYLELDVPDHTGTYKIISVTHDLNYEGGRWTTQLDAEKVS